MKPWLLLPLSCLSGIAAALLLELGLMFSENLLSISTNLGSIFLFTMSLACPLGMMALFYLINNERYAEAEKVKVSQDLSYLDLLLEQRRKLQTELEEIEDMIAEEGLQPETIPSSEYASE
jgi:hypothetical protein